MEAPGPVSARTLPAGDHEARRLLLTRRGARTLAGSTRAKKRSGSRAYVLSKRNTERRRTLGRRGSQGPRDEAGMPRGVVLGTRAARARIATHDERPR